MSGIKDYTRITIYARNHVSSGAIKRVWRSDWSGDMFEIMSDLDFERSKHTFERFGFPVVFLTQEEESE